MASNNTIKINLDFSANTQNAKSAIQDLSNSLNSIATSGLKGFGDATVAEIQKGQDAAARLKAILNESFNVNTGKLDLGRFQQSMKRAGTDLQSLRVNLQALGPTGVQAFTNLARTITAAEIPVFRLNDKIKKLGSTFANTMRWQISSSVLNMMVSSVQNAFQYAQELNESLTNIRIVTGYSAEAMDEFASHANKAAKALSTTTNEYAKASLIYFQQGLSDAEVEKRTATTIKLANVTGESAETVSEWMTAVWNNFDDGSKSLEHYADVMTALGAATASSSDEIAGGLEKFAAIAKTIGLSYEYAASALATVTAVTRQSEDVVGTAFKTIFGRMEGLELGQTLDDGVTLNKYSEALSSVGVNILDVNGELKDMDTILNDLGGRWDSLSQGQKVALAQVVGGMRQYNQLIALMDNWGYFQENLNTAMGSQGALSRQADIYAESWQAAMNNVKSTAEEMYGKLLDDETIITLIDGFAGFLGIINDVIDALGGMKGVLFALGAVLTSVFSDKIVASISTLTLNIQSMSKTGRQALEKMRQNAWTEATQGLNEGSVTENARAQQLTFESKLEQDYQKIFANRSVMEQEIYRTKINILKASMEENVKAADNVQLLKQQAIEAKKALAAKQDKLFGRNREVVSNLKFKIPSQKDIQNGEAWGINFENVQKLRQQFGQTNPVINAFVDKLNSGKFSAQQLKQELIDLADRASIVNLPDKEVEKLNQAETNATNLTNAYNEKLKELELTSKKTQDGVRGLSEEMNNLPPPKKTVEQQLVSLTNTLMQVGMAWSAIQNIGDIFKNDDLTAAEKMTQILMSMAMILPTISTAIKGITTLWKQDTVEKIKNAAATWGQIISEKILKKTRSGHSVSTDTNIDSDDFEIFKKADKNGKERTYVRNKGTGKTTFATKDQTELLKNSGKATTTIKSSSLSSGQASKIGAAASSSAGASGAAASTASGTSGAAASSSAAASGGAGASGGAAMSALGSLGLIVAAIATIAATIYIWYRVLNRSNELAKRAEKNAENIKAAFGDAKQAYEDLKSSIASYEDAKKGLSELTRGTQEYRDALASANETAMELIKKNANLKWHYEDGLIVFDDEEQLKDYQEQEQQKLAKLQASSLQADAFAAKKRQEANELDYLRSVGGGTATSIWSGIGTGFLAGGGAGAAIGTVIAPGWGSLIGAGIGSIIGAVAGGISGAAIGESTAEEERALEALKEEYNRLSNKGEQLGLKDEQTMKIFLEKEGFGQNIVDALTKNTDATYALLESNAALDQTEKLAAQAMVDAQNADNKLYTESIYREAMQADMANKMVDENSEEFKKKLEEMEDQYVSWGTNLFGFINTDGQKALWKRYVENAYGGEFYDGGVAQEGQYKVTGQGGDSATLHKFIDGEWKKQGVLERDDALKYFAKEELSEFSDDDLKKYLEKYAKQSTALYKVGVKSLQARIDVINQAANSGNNSLEDLSDFNEAQINALRSEFDVTEAINNRQKDIDDLKESLISNQEKYSYSMLTLGKDLSYNQLKLLTDTIISTMDTAGPEALTNLTAFLDQYSAEEQEELLKILETIDWSAPTALETFLYQVGQLEDIKINIDENNPALNSFANEMQNAALAAESLADQVDTMVERVSKSLKTLKDKTIGDTISNDEYAALIKEYPNLASNFIRTIEGYQLLTSGERLSKSFLQNELQISRKTLNSSKAAEKDFKRAYEETNLASQLAEISKLSLEDQKKEYDRLINNGLISESMLSALGTNAYNVVHSNSLEDLFLFNTNLQTAIESQGKSVVDDLINADIASFRLMYPRASKAVIEKFLGTFNLTEEEIKKYLQNWDADIKLDAWNYFIEDVLNGIEMEASQENLEELDKSLSRLNDQAFSSAEALNNLALQMKEIANQNQLITANLPTYLTSDEIAALGEAGAEAYYEQLKNAESILEENKEAIEEIYKTMADQVLKAFQDWNEEFTKINSKAEYFQSIVDNYKSIVNLTREFTKMDSSILKQLGDTSERIAKTQMVNAKNNYEALMVSRAKIVDEMNYAMEQDLGGLGYYWQKQLDEIDQMIQKAHTNYLESWNSALQAAADNYKSHIEEIMNDFEKSMTGAFGSYDSLLKHYDQQKKLSQLYLADYEKAYELSKLIRQLDSSIDETDSLKNKTQLRDLQKQINKLSESDTKLSQYQLEYLQKQYDLTLAQIALEEAQEAKHQVRLQRTASGSWGYVYTADDNKINEAQQNYEDKLFNLQKLSQEYIQQMQESYLQIEAEYAEQIKAIYNSDATKEEKEEAIKNANAFYQESMQYYVDQLDIATEHNKQTYLDDAGNYLANVDKKDLANKGLVASTDQDLSDIEKRFDDFKNKLGDFGSLDEKTNSFSSSSEDSLFGQLGKAYNNYRTSADAILDLAGTDFSDLGNTIANVIGDPGDSETGKGGTGINGELTELEHESDVTFSNMISDIGDLAAILPKQINSIVNEYNKLISKLQEVQSQANLTYNELMRQKKAENGEDWEFEEPYQQQDTEFDINDVDAEIKQAPITDSLTGIGQHYVRKTKDYPLDRSLPKSEQLKLLALQTLEKDGQTYYRFSDNDALNQFFTEDQLKISDEQYDSRGNWFSVIAHGDGALFATQGLNYGYTLETLKEALKNNKPLQKKTVDGLWESFGYDYSDSPVHGEKVDEILVLPNGLITTRTLFDSSQQLVNGINAPNKLSFEEFFTTTTDEERVISLKTIPYDTLLAYLNGELEKWSSVEENLERIQLAVPKLNAQHKKNAEEFGRDTSLDPSFYDTGGYTGAWGPEGRWAMLHQKEIVLNATDTENFLSAIGILRSIVEMIDLRAAATAFNNSSLRSQTVQTQTQTLEQQVTIHAEFPNVTDHYEIEEALNNIVNTASQYANRKI